LSENLTPLSSRSQILGDLWMNYRDDEEFRDFIEYNDLGLPLSYAFANGIVEKATPAAEQLINETFELLLGALEIPVDEGFESLDDLLEI
jgi:hypothetical protein